MEDDRKKIHREEDGLIRKMDVQGRLPYKRLVTQTTLDHGTNKQGGVRLVNNKTNCYISR